MVGGCGVHTFFCIQLSVSVVQATHATGARLVIRFSCVWDIWCMIRTTASNSQDTTHYLGDDVLCLEVYFLLSSTFL